MSTQAVEILLAVIGSIIGIPTLALIFKIGMGWGALAEHVGHIAEALDQLIPAMNSVTTKIAVVEQRLADHEQAITDLKSKQK